MRPQATPHGIEPVIKRSSDSKSGRVAKCAARYAGPSARPRCLLRFAQAGLRRVAAAAASRLGYQAGAQLGRLKEVGYCALLAHDSAGDCALRRRRGRNGVRRRVNRGQTDRPAPARPGACRTQPDTGPAVWIPTRGVGVGNTPLGPVPAQVGAGPGIGVEGRSGPPGPARPLRSGQACAADTSKVYRHQQICR
jgi:hypothetical protein